ncbi:MAG: alpha/beta hydrolase [Anaerolineales bacterium]|nr:alpha/beta hydrolase [Anaerolineales bacterium]
MDTVKSSIHPGERPSCQSPHLTSFAHVPISPRGCLRRLLQLLGGGLLILLLLIGGWSWLTNRRVAASEIYPAAADAPGQFLTIDGYRLHVQTFGDPAAPPLLLVHGFSVGGGSDWANLAAALQGDYYLIVPDLLGFGHSQRVTEPVPAYSHAGQAALLVGVLDALGVAETAVAGHSYGGGVAVQLALDAPARVSRLILVDAQVYDVGGGFFQALGNLPLGIGRAITWSTLGAGPQAELLARSSCAGGGECPTDAYLARRQRLAQIEDTTAALLAFNQTSRDARIPADVPQVTQPALVIWGEADPIIPLANGERLAAELPTAELHTLPGAGHSPQLFLPRQVADLVRAFMPAQP